MVRWRILGDHPQKATSRGPGSESALKKCNVLIALLSPITPDFGVIDEDQSRFWESDTFFSKGQKVNSVGFVGHMVSVTLPRCLCSMKAAISMCNE